MLVGEDRRREGRTVVASETDEHQSSLGNVANGLELEFLLDGFRVIPDVTLRVDGFLDRGRVEDVLCEEFLFRVGQVGRSDLNRFDGTTSGGRIDGRVTGNSRGRRVVVVVVRSERSVGRHDCEKGSGLG